MEVKGAAILSLQSFVMTKHGIEAYQDWIEHLPPRSKEILRSSIDIEGWYPMHEGLHQPTKLVCDLLYGRKLDGAWLLGRYSAEFSLNTLMKVFLRVQKVDFILKRAPAIIERYYRPCSVRVTENEGKRGVILIEGTELMTSHIEYRIGGWMEKGIELTGGKDPKVEITRSWTKSNPRVEYTVIWD